LLGCGRLAIGFEVPFTGYDVHVPALLVKLVDQGPVYLTGGAQGAEGSILCSAILASGIALFAGSRGVPNNQR
jgi:uncharacterized protein